MVRVSALPALVLGEPWASHRTKNSGTGHLAHNISVVSKGLGYRSSKAAGGLKAIFEGKRADRRNATLADLPKHWAGPPPAAFHKLYYGVADCIQGRDQPVPSGLNTVRMARDAGMEVPKYRRQKSPHESGGGPSGRKAR